MFLGTTKFGGTKKFEGIAPECPLVPTGLGVDTNLFHNLLLL